MNEHEDTLGTGICKNFKTRISKIEQYGWKIVDVQGEFRHIPLNKLELDRNYQRQPSRARIRKIAREWSWALCGSLIVADRGGRYFIIDGQHRFLAARNFKKIESLPCMIYKFTNAHSEAGCFVSSNMMRKSPRTVEKHKAACYAGDEESLFLQKTCDELGIKITKNTGSPLTMHCVKAAMIPLKRDRVDFLKLMKLIAQLCENDTINEKLVLGLDYIGTLFDLEDSRLRARIIKIGPIQLTNAANNKTSRHEKGGAKQYALAMLDLINKGLKKPFSYEIIATTREGKA